MRIAEFIRPVMRDAMMFGLKNPNSIKRYNWRMSMHFCPDCKELVGSGDDHDCSLWDSFIETKKTEWFKT